MQQNEQNDNRMQWIRNCEESNENNAYHYIDYEIASETRITGYFDYYQSKILCSLLTSKPYNHLYYYTLRVKHPHPKEPYYNSNAEEDGYFFNGGISGELLALFALFFRCRFYLTGEQNIDSDIKKLPSKILLEFHRYPCIKKIYTHLFSEQNNFNTGPTAEADNLTQFLDKVKNLDVTFQQFFILSCQHYLQALQEIGKDQEMIFIRLVSAIEAMSKTIKLDLKKDPLQYKNFQTVGQCLKEQGWKEEDITELRNTFDVRKSKKKFIRFCAEYSKGFFEAEILKPNSCISKKKDGEKALERIYSARSKYLHAGEPMFISNWCGRENWDYDSSTKRVIDNKAFTAKFKLPHDVSFEKFVRHCLLAFLSQHTTTNLL